MLIYLTLMLMLILKIHLIYCFANVSIAMLIQHPKGWFSFTSDGSRSRREPYALVKTARHKQKKKKKKKKKKKETFPFSSASASAFYRWRKATHNHSNLDKPREATTGHTPHNLLKLCQALFHKQPFMRLYSFQ